MEHSPISSFPLLVEGEEEEAAAEHVAAEAVRLAAAVLAEAGKGAMIVVSGTDCGQMSIPHAR